MGTLAGYFRASTDVNGISGAALWAVSNAAVRRGSASVVFRMCLMRVLLFRGGGFGGGGLQQQLHDAPRFDLSRIDHIRIAAIERVGDLKDIFLLAGMAEASEDCAVELHLVNLACVFPRAGQVAVRIRIR